MIKLVWDPAFKQAYKKRVSKDVLLKEKFWDSIKTFEENPFDKFLKTHKLTGKLKDFWAFSVDDDCRVVFQFFDNRKEILLIDIGSHDEVY